MSPSSEIEQEPLPKFEEAKSFLQNNFPDIDPEQVRPQYEQVRATRGLGQIDRARSQGIGENFKPLPSWDEVGEHFQTLFPDLDQEGIKKQYESARQIHAGYQKWHSKSPTPTTYETIATNLDKLSSRMTGRSSTDDSWTRIKEGNGTDEDFDRVTHLEHLKKSQEAFGESPLGGITQGLIQAPSFISQLMLARGALPEAKGAGVFTQAALSGLATPLAPGTWLEGAAERAEKGYYDPKTKKMMPGGQWYEPRNIIPALGMSTLTNMVAGSAGEWAKGFENPFARIMASGATFTGEMQAAQFLGGHLDQVLPNAYKLNTGYGAVGNIMRGEYGDALKKVTTEAITGSIFQTAHLGVEAHLKSIKGTATKIKEVLDNASASGKTPDQAAAILRQVMSPAEKMAGQIKALGERGGIQTEEAAPTKHPSLTEEGKVRDRPDWTPTSEEESNRKQADTQKWRDDIWSLPDGTEFTPTAEQDSARTKFRKNSEQGVSYLERQNPDGSWTIVHKNAKDLQKHTKSSMLGFSDQLHNAPTSKGFFPNHLSGADVKLPSGKPSAPKPTAESTEPTGAFEKWKQEQAAKAAAPPEAPATPQEAPPQTAQEPTQPTLTVEEAQEVLKQLEPGKKTPKDKAIARAQELLSGKSALPKQQKATYQGEEEVQHLPPYQAPEGPGQKSNWEKLQEEQAKPSQPTTQAVEPSKEPGKLTGKGKAEQYPTPGQRKAEAEADKAVDIANIAERYRKKLSGITDREAAVQYLTRSREKGGAGMFRSKAESVVDHLRGEGGKRQASFIGKIKGMFGGEKTRKLEEPAIRSLDETPTKEASDERHNNVNGRMNPKVTEGVKGSLKNVNFHETQEDIGKAFYYGDQEKATAAIDAGQVPDAFADQFPDGTSDLHFHLGNNEWVIAHEYGHVIANKFGLETNPRIVDAYNKDMADGQFTHYGSKNYPHNTPGDAVAEGVAEFLALLHDGGFTDDIERSLPNMSKAIKDAGLWPTENVKRLPGSVEETKRAINELRGHINDAESAAPGEEGRYASRTKPTGKEVPSEEAGTAPEESAREKAKVGAKSALGMNAKEAQSELEQHQGELDNAKDEHARENLERHAGDEASVRREADAIVQKGFSDGAAAHEAERAGAPPTPHPEAEAAPGAAEPAGNGIVPGKTIWNHKGTQFSQEDGQTFFADKNGEKHSIVANAPNENGDVTIHVRSQDNKLDAYALLKKNPDGKYAVRNVDVRDPSQKRRGLANAIYDYATEKLGPVTPSGILLDEGEAIWKANQKTRREAPGAAGAPGNGIGQTLESKQTSEERRKAFTEGKPDVLAGASPDRGITKLEAMASGPMESIPNQFTRKQFSANLGSVLGRMGQKIHDLIDSSVLKGFFVHHTLADLRADIDKNLMPGDQPSRALAFMRFTKDGTELHFYGKNDQWTLAHEIGHVVDFSQSQRGKAISRDKSFQSAWKAELADGQITSYGALNPAEGFAEMFGLLYGGGFTDGLEQQFPKVSKTLKDNGMWPTTENKLPQTEAENEAAITKAQKELEDAKEFAIEDEDKREVARSEREGIHSGSTPEEPGKAQTTEKPVEEAGQGIGAFSEESQARAEKELGGPKGIAEFLRRDTAAFKILPDAETQKNLVEGAIKAAKFVRDSLRRLGNKAYPTAHSIDREAGEALQRYSAAANVSYGLGEEFGKEYTQDAKREFIEAAASGPMGHLGKDPPKGFVDSRLDLDGKSLYVTPEVAGEIDSAFGFQSRGYKTVAKIAQVANYPWNMLGMASSLEAVWHMATGITPAFLSGAGPIWGKTVKAMGDYFRNNPDIQARLSRMEIEGSARSFTQPEAPEWMKKIGLGAEARGAIPVLNRLRLPGTNISADPTNILGAGIHHLDNIMRLAYDMAHEELVKQGKKPNTQQSRVDFVNEALFNYDKKAQNILVRALRETGIGQFATAATGGVMRGVSTLAGSPGQSTSFAAAQQMRGEIWARQLAPIAATLAYNYLVHGSVQPGNSPFASVYLGKDEEGKDSYYDVGRFIPGLKGAKSIGLKSFLEGTAKGEPVDKTLNKMKDDWLHTLTHPVMGPGATFWHMVATGKDANGYQVVKQAGKKGDQVDLINNLLEALRRDNSIIFAATGGEHPGKIGSAEKAWKALAGPFATQSAK